MSAYSLPLGSRLSPAASDTEALLVSDGDARLALDPVTGCNRYGCAPRPDPELLDFASSTASVISATGFRAADALRQRLARAATPREDGLLRAREDEAIRAEILSLLGLSDVKGIHATLAPSGTDLHYLALPRAMEHGHAARRGLTVILPEPAETGSGVPAVLGGPPLRLAYPEKDSGRISLRTVPVRDGKGRPRLVSEVDADCCRLSEEALADGDNLLLVLLDVSKTGLTLPSPDWALMLGARHPGRVRVLVDACQGRLAGTTIRAWLEAGAMVAFTGSKFFGGPVFSGVLLEKRSDPAPTSPVWVGGAGRPGLLLRWRAALAEMRAFCGVPSADVATCLSNFDDGLKAMLAGYPGVRLMAAAPLPARDRLDCPLSWDSRRSIFPLRLLGRDGSPLSPSELRLVYELLGREAGHGESGGWQDALGRIRVHLGQPVAWANPDGSPGAVLRLCLSARQVTGALDRQGLEALLAQAETALAKLSWLASAAIR